MAGMTMVSSSSAAARASGAMAVVQAQQHLVSSQTDFSAAMADLKAGLPDAKSHADAAGKALKSAQAALDAATAQLAASSSKTKGSEVSAPAPSTADFFSARSAFKDVSSIQSLADIPAIPASGCGAPQCRHTPRILAACSCDIAAAYSGLSAKELNVARGHLHGLRSSDNVPKEVQMAAKEVYSVVNAAVNNSRGGNGGAGTNQMGGQKSKKGGNTPKMSHGRKN